MTGPAMRKLRIKAGLSLQTVANAAGLSYSTVNFYERGHRVKDKTRNVINAALADLTRQLAMPQGTASVDLEPSEGQEKVRPGVFNRAWLRAQIKAWQREGVTVAVAHRGDPAAAPVSVYVATEAELHELGRRFVLALTGRNVQE